MLSALCMEIRSRDNAKISKARFLRIADARVGNRSADLETRNGLSLGGSLTNHPNGPWHTEWRTPARNVGRLGRGQRVVLRPAAFDEALREDLVANGLRRADSFRGLFNMR
ncbi:MAG: hypothetical protein ACP5EN_09590 [Rhodovulum sp.]